MLSRHLHKPIYTTRPVDGSKRKWMREFVQPPENWTFDTFNRMRFWMQVPPGTQQSTGGRHNISTGTYVRKSDGDIYSYENGGGHYYHHLNIPYTGEWHQIIVDTHPDAKRGISGGIEIGDREYPTGEDSFNYFDAMTRFYVDGANDLTSYPATFLFDGFELYRETQPENIDQIYSLNGVYVPANNKIVIGWQRNKDENSIKHEVRYAFQSVHSIGWNAAIPAPDGTVVPPGHSGYNGMDWSTQAIDVSGHDIIYIAIKPQNSSLFRQIAIPLTGGEVTTPSTTLIGDLNADGTVNTLDWSIMSGVWFTSNAQSDLNSDGIVNSIDFSLLNANWGRTQ